MQGDNIVKQSLALGCALLLLSSIGCGYSRPLLRGPGTMQQQQYEASLHDPYPDNQAGPPVVGGRPLEFQAPLAEPVRNRWLRDSWWSK
jgi:hypothetical protein